MRETDGLVTVGWSATMVKRRKPKQPVSLPPEALRIMQIGVDDYIDRLGKAFEAHLRKRHGPPRPEASSQSGDSQG